MFRRELCDCALWKRCKIRFSSLRSFATVSESQEQESTYSSGSTVSRDDVKYFSDLAHTWWDAIHGPHAILHQMNDVRVPFVRDALKNLPKTPDMPRSPSKPLLGRRILDVGCGGGLLCEPLARLGGSIVGVDASEACVAVAQEHAKYDDITAANIDYVHGTVEELVTSQEGGFDAVVASEVIEHVNDVPLFVSSCCKLTKPGGSVIMTTVNRTQLSYWLTIIAAEIMFGLLPRGAHSWDKFVSPDELQFEMSKNGCQTRLIHGLLYNPVTRRWSWTGATDVNYAIQAIKNPA